MSAQFEWQTDEDGQWEQLVPSESAPAKEQTARLFYPRLTFVLLFLLLGTITILLRRQVLQAEATVQQEVLAANALAMEAAFTGDAELFRTLLSGRDQAWTDTQLVLAVRELALGNSARLFGLEPLPGDLDLEIVAISPDLNEVEIETVQRYRPAGPGPASAPVALTQTYFYRRGTAQWLLSPPEDKSAYWGTFQSLTGRYLTILYPARDAEFIEQMATDLERDLAAICARLPAECPDDWHIVLRLERNPASLLSMAGQKYIMDIGPSVVMPTPSLVGRPVDESGYQHLYRAYATYVIGLTLTRVVEYECCHRAAYYTAMLNWFMAAEAGTGWPLTGTNYATALQFPISLDALESIFSHSDFAFLSAEEQMMVHAFVEFMLVKAEGKGELAPELASLPTMTDRLTGHPGFWSWVESMSDYSRLDEELLVQDWMRFIAGRNKPVLLAGKGSPSGRRLIFRS